MANSVLAEKRYNVITIEPTKKTQEAKLRVAAYCRVSSASDDQLNSFAAQYSYYTEFINGNENWKLVDIYADEGVSGVSIEKRDDFKRLIADCHRGLIDRILVKSISRFARNTTECLETSRKLKTLGVSVYFEEQDIDTATVNSELLTSVFAAIAQKESESISQNMRWSYQHRMQRGTFNTCRAPFGYRLQNGSLEIAEDEAEVVKYIFDEYLSGKETREIAKRLSQRESSRKKWCRETVEYILKNERYAGNALLQKRYATDILPRKMAYNHGEKERFFVENINPPIVSEGIFNKAQMLRESRSKRPIKENRYLLSGAVVCGCCGTLMRTKVVREKKYMVCRKHEENIKVCRLPPISEVEVIAAFLRVYFKLKHHPEILSQLVSNLEKIRNRRMLWSPEAVELNKKISELSSQNQMLTQLKRNGLVDPDIFISQANTLAEELRKAKIQKERLVEADGDNTLSVTNDLIEIIATAPEVLEGFDGELFSELIDRIIVVDNETLRFCLKNGQELTERIERTRR